MAVQIDESWKQLLEKEWSSPYFQEIKAHLLKRKNEGATVLPPGKLIFNAFDTTPVDEVKVVILGQDPYHRIGQAMGLSFSVPPGVRIPPSLRNIYKELKEDVGCEIPNHGDLTNWAKQGVFLLNAMLTVEEGKPGAHAKIGWQQFTDNVIKALSEHRNGLIFMLWGNFAKNKAALIDANKHTVLTAAHPSPMAGGAFFGSRHFSKANDILKAQGQEAIDWAGINK